MVKLGEKLIVRPNGKRIRYNRFRLMQTNITILISVRNEEAYIGPTIKSILAQTYKNFELWVIDDGSTDKTWGKIQSFKDKRIKSFHFDQNTGLTSRLNWAVPRVRTEFIARMDSHNLADPTRLQKQLDYMISHPEVMALGSNFIRQDESRKVFFHSHFPTNYQEIKAKLMERNLFKHGSMFFRRKVYGLVGLYDPYFRLSQDYDFVLKVAARFPVANLPENLVTEIYRSQNMTQKHRVRSAWEALVAQWNGLTKYGYPLWQSVYLIRGLSFLLKSWVYSLLV